MLRPPLENATSRKTNGPSDLEQRHEQESLLKIQRELGLENSATKEAQDQSLAAYQRLLRGKFDQARHDVARLKLSELQSSPAFTRWMEARSSMLVVYGNNATHDQTNMESWLSEPAVDFIQAHLTRKPGNPTDGNVGTPGSQLAYYLCTKRDQHKDVLSGIILRLLEGNPAVLRGGSDLHAIESNVTRFTGYASPQSRSAAATPRSSPLPDLESPGSKTRAKLRQEFKAGGAALSHIVEWIGVGSGSIVYIVVDRPEVCDGENMGLLLDTLLGLVRDAAVAGEPVRVKIWLVMRAEFWRAGYWLDGLDDRESLEASGKLVLCRNDQGFIGG